MTEPIQHRIYLAVPGHHICWGPVTGVINSTSKHIVKPFNADTFELYKDPGFQYRLKEGQALIEQGANAGGTRFSGATLKALSDFGQESASQEYGAARARAVDASNSRPSPLSTARRKRL